jgi:hypothetical protein
MASEQPSYFSRFFTKFVEIAAAGLASAVSAYLLAHFGSLLSSATTAPTAPVPAAIEHREPAPPQDAEARGSQPERKAAVKGSKNAVAPKAAAGGTSTAEKNPRGEKSAEALAREALANVDAAAVPPVRPESIASRPGAVDVQTRPADLPPPPVAAIPPRASAVEVAPLVPGVQPAPPQIPGRPTSADLQPPPPDVRTGSVTDIPSRPVAAEPLPPSAGARVGTSPSGVAGPRQDETLFSALKRVPDLLRPDAPPPIGDVPRPPMPVGNAAPE